MSLPRQRKACAHAWLALAILSATFDGGFSTKAEYWRNVAVGKPSNMSSTLIWSGNLLEARLANDGDRNPGITQLSCSESLKQYAPWWMVDLQERYLILGVRLTSRDKNPHRLSNFTVELSEFSTGDGGLVGGRLCHYEPGAQDIATTVFYPCSKKTVARYVKLMAHHYDTEEKLCVCEVEIMATDYEMHYEMRGLKGQRSKNEMLENVNTSGVIMCQSHCLRLERCTSFNAIPTGPQEILCEMINDPSPWLHDNDSREQGWTHYVPFLHGHHQVFLHTETPGNNGFGLGFVFGPNYLPEQWARFTKHTKIAWRPGPDSTKPS